MEFFSRRHGIKKKHVLFVIVIILIIIFLFDFKYHNKPNESDKSLKSVQSIRDNKGMVVKEKAKDVANYAQPVDTGSCKIFFDPFHPSMTKVMRDFGKHECFHPNELKMKVKNNQLSISGYNINFISSKEIKSVENTFEYGEDHYLLEAQSLDPRITKGSSGALKNDATKVCINLDKSYKDKNSPDEIILLFSSECFGSDVVFIYTEEGYIKHQETGMCFGLRKGDSSPRNDAIIVLTKKCEQTFEVVQDGVLRTASKFCIHPLGGGQPTDGQKLCYYSDCSNTSRLIFKFTEAKKAVSKLFEKDVKLQKELNYLKFGMIDSYTYSGYALSVQRKALENLKVASETHPNIYVIAFDETSSNHFKRKLPKSSNYLLNDMKAIDYKLHASVTDSSPENVIRILTGEDIFGNDVKYKTVFSVANEANYVTLFSSDVAFKDFNNTIINSNHNTLPLFQSMKTNFDAIAHQYCTLSQPIYDLSLDYLTSFIDAYSSEAKLGIIFLSEITRHNYNNIGYVDASLLALLKKIHALKNTILIVTSIKGSTVGNLGKLAQGLIEHKRPLLNIYNSDSLSSLDAARSTQITSPFDLYSTICHVISQKEPETKYGLSLLKTASKKRDCLAAGVAKSMCPCNLE